MINKRIIHTIPVLFSLLFLVQSCQVYKKTKLHISEVADTKTRVKVRTFNGETIKFKRVELVESQYYGYKRINWKLERVPIDIGTIESVRKENTTLSAVYSILLTAGVVLVTAVIIGSRDVVGIGALSAPN